MYYRVNMCGVMFMESDLPLIQEPVHFACLYMNSMLNSLKLISKQVRYDDTSSFSCKKRSIDL